MGKVHIFRMNISEWYIHLYHSNEGFEPLGKFYFVPLNGEKYVMNIEILKRSDHIFLSGEVWMILNGRAIWCDLYYWHKPLVFYQVNR